MHAPLACTFPLLGKLFPDGNMSHLCFVATYP